MDKSSFISMMLTSFSLATHGKLFKEKQISEERKYVLS